MSPETSRSTEPHCLPLCLHRTGLYFQLSTTASKRLCVKLKFTKKLLIIFFSFYQLFLYYSFFSTEYSLSHMFQKPVIFSKVDISVPHVLTGRSLRAALCYPHTGMWVAVTTGPLSRMWCLCRVPCPISVVWQTFFPCCAHQPRRPQSVFIRSQLREFFFSF